MKEVERRTTRRWPDPLRLGVRAAVALGVFAGAAHVAGCGSTCFLQDCDEGGTCHCSVSNCGDGASFDTKAKRCLCTAGYSLVQGNCLQPDEANEFCGQGQRWGGSGCVPDKCNPGEELDQSSGRCLAHDVVNQMAAKNLGVQVGQGERLGCPEGQKLILDGPNAACVPLAQTCARDETWSGTACVKVTECAAGSSWDAGQNKCVAFTKASDQKEQKLVDVAQWTATNIGKNGAQGTSAFCGGFSKKPYLFSIASGSSATLRIVVTMTFEGAEIGKGVIQTTSVFEGTGLAVPPKGAEEIDASAKAIFGTLVKGGGKADAASAATMVKCPMASAAKPKPVPATGGL